MFVCVCVCGYTSQADSSTLDTRIDAYERAMDAYLQESPPRTVAANGCREQVALLCVERRTSEDLRKAAALFQDMAQQSLAANLTKYNAKGHMMKACVCILAEQDFVKANEVVMSYQSQDASFADSQEEVFVLALIQAIEQQNADALAAASSDFNSIKRLDPWIVSILLDVKKDMTPPEPELEDDGEEHNGENDAHDDEEDPDLS